MFVDVHYSFALSFLIFAETLNVTNLTSKANLTNNQTTPITLKPNTSLNIKPDSNIASNLTISNNTLAVDLNNNTNQNATGNGSRNSENESDNEDVESIEDENSEDVDKGESNENATFFLTSPLCHAGYFFDWDENECIPDIAYELMMMNKQEQLLKKKNLKEVNDEKDDESEDGIHIDFQVALVHAKCGIGFMTDPGNSHCLPVPIQHISPPEEKD